MRVYLDTSVALRVLFREKDRLEEWGRWDQAYSSQLWLVEASRTIDRMRLSGSMTDEMAARAREIARRIDESLHIVPVTEKVLSRAGGAFPTALGTLDAIHLASALAIHDTSPLDWLLTHDRQLAIAARGVGLDVQGI